MSSYREAHLSNELEDGGVRTSRASRRRAILPRIALPNRTRATATIRGACLTALIVATAVGAAGEVQAAPAPEVEYVYDVMVRRHYSFANPDEAVKYGYEICGKVSQGEGYAQIMSDVKSGVGPNDEFAANYLISYAVNLLCPAQIWQLRNSAAGYQPPAS